MTVATPTIQALEITQKWGVPQSWKSLKSGVGTRGSSGLLTLEPTAVAAVTSGRFSGRRGWRRGCP